MLDVKGIQQQFQKIADERDWNQFHNPKNLSMALSVEASELMEIFQWMTEEESKNIIGSNKMMAVRDEVADIALYLLRLSDLLNINLSQAIQEKLEKNIAKYPVELSRGNAKKYTEFMQNEYTD